jgi:hypothetical protein
MAMLLRLGETVFICVLNDAGGAASILAEDIKKIKGPLSAQQCRELLAHASYAILLIENRPTFHTAVDPRQEKLTISSQFGEVVQTRDFVPAEFGDVLSSVFAPDIYRRFHDPEEARARVRSGHATFLFDNDGKFIADGL